VMTTNNEDTLSMIMFWKFDYRMVTVWRMFGVSSFSRVPDLRRTPSTGPRYIVQLQGGSKFSWVCFMVCW
jgi:hypothetical protein